MILADLKINGKPRKVIMQANKNGFFYVLDRITGEFISGQPFSRVTWAKGIDQKTGRPIINTEVKYGKDPVPVSPGGGGAHNWSPMSFNPNTGLVYASTWNVPRLQKLAASNPQALGTVSTGVVARNPTFKPGDVVGAFVAVNPVSGEKKWEAPLTEMPSAAGMLATDGGLIFTGKLTGEFVALDADTGRTLWQLKLSSSVNSTAITYTHKGQQYVSVASGLGGAVAPRFAADKVPSGGSLWTFALMPD